MSKFKVGDRVRYVTDQGWTTKLPNHELGDEFTVVEVSHSRVRLDPEVWSASGSGTWWFDWRFELVTETELEWTEVEAKDLKKGEKVQYLDVEWSVDFVNKYGGAFYRMSAGFYRMSAGETLHFRPNTKVKALRPKPLELPKPGDYTPFWAKAESFHKSQGLAVRHPGHPDAFLVGGRIFHSSWVTRLPWPADELEKFKAGLK